MAVEMITQLPTVTNAALSDIIYAVQGYASPSSPGTSVQETLQQVFQLLLGNVVLNNAGNPNGVVAGQQYQLLWDSTDQILYICTTTGNATTAVWTPLPPGATITNPAHGGTGVANPPAHAIAIAEGSAIYNFLTLSNGQLLIGNAGNDPTAATLTAGMNISITNAAGSITISAVGPGGFSWNHVTSSTQTMASNNGYVADNAALVTFTLPATSVLGDELEVVGRGAGGWTIAQGAGQQIIFGVDSSTVGAGGSLSSTNRRDCVYLVCTNASQEWTVASGPEGNLTIV